MRLSIALVVVISINVIREIHSIGPLATQDKLFDLDGIRFPNTSDQSSNALRFRRDPSGDIVKQSVERMQMISRLTNAIYLQNELSNGATIKTDKLISELLHFGSTTPTLIHAIKEKEVVSALQGLENLPADIKESGATKKLEDFFTTTNSITELMPDVKDMSNWEGKEDFKADITRLKDEELDLGFVEELYDDMSTHSVSIKLVNSKPPFKEADYTKAENLKAASSGLLAKGEQLAQKIPQLFTFTKKKNAIDAVGHLKQVTEGVKKLKEKATDLSIDKTGMDEFKSNIASIQKTVEDFKSINADLKLVNDFLMAYSTKTQSTPIEYTIGLPDGYNDINQLFNHFNNPWFTETIKDKKLEEAFRRLKMWRPAVDNILKPLDKITEEKVKKISEVFASYKKLSTDFSNFASETADKVENCIQSIPPTTVYYDKTDALIQHVENIDKSFEEIYTSLEYVRKTLNSDKNREILKKSVAACENLKKNDEASLITCIQELQKLKKTEDIIMVFNDAINKLIPIRSELKLTLKENAANATDLFPDIDPFLATVNPFSTILNCLLGDDIKKVNTLALRTKEHRKLKDDSSHKNKFESAVEIVETVAGTKNDLKSLEDSIKGMKGFKSKESDYLNLLENADNHYKVIGLSTEGIVGLKRVIDKKSDLDILKQQANLITDETKNNAKNLDPDEKKLLDDLASLHTSLVPLFTSLDTWKDQVSKLNMTTLPNYSMVFTEAKAVSALAPDIEKMSSALDKLIELVTTPNKKEVLKKVRNSLKTLVGVGMKYASYTKNFDQSEKSLKALDLFFVSRFARASATPAPSVSSNRNSGGGGQAAQSKTEPPSNLTSSQIVWIIVSTLLISLCFFYIVVTWWKIQMPLYQSKEFKPDERKKVKYERVSPTKDGLLAFMKLFKASLSKYAEENKDNKIDDKIVYDPDDPKNREEVEKMEAKEVKDRRSDVFRFWCRNVHSTVDHDMKEWYSDCVKKHLRETRYDMAFTHEDRVTLPTSGKGIKFKTDYYHGNYLVLRNGAQRTLFQAPRVVKTNTKFSIKKLPCFELGKVPNYDKIWYLVKQEKCKRIFVLCNFEEYKGDKKEEKCCPYFPTKVKGEKKDTEVKGKNVDYTVRCIDSKTNEVEKDGKKEAGTINTLTLRLKFKDDKDYDLTLSQYLGWPDHSAPESTDEFVKLLMEARECPDNVFVHCSAGIGRTGTFALTEMMYLEVVMNEDHSVDYAELLHELRLVRARAVQYPVQFIFAIVALVCLLVETVPWEEERNALPTEDAKRAFDMEKNACLAWKDTLVETYKNALKREKEDKKKKKTDEKKKKKKFLCC